MKAGNVQRDGGLILSLNAGSSSLKFAAFRTDTTPGRVLSGVVDRIGLPDSTLTLGTNTSRRPQHRAVAAPDHAGCVELLVEERRKLGDHTALLGLGHRVVHGGASYTQPERVTTEMLNELRRLSAFAPEHLPGEIDLIAAFAKRFPNVPQVACFDTAFHRNLPRVARLLPIPRRYEAAGVRRYGFHGLSYEFLMEELTRNGDSAARKGRVILAHLGNGASLAAVRDGQCIDTSMAFTPAAGLMMGRRSGDLDPGLVSFLTRTERMTAEDFDRLVNHQSGLLGVSEINSDMRELLVLEKTDSRAAEAVALFCYTAKKWIGGFAAALGGLDTLVFTAGIGENNPVIRARVCDGLGFLGLELDDTRNAANAAVVSADSSRIAVRVIRTDEELMIARSVSRVLGLGGAEKGIQI
jgi:acetate kinase